MDICISFITESDIAAYQQCLDTVCREERFLAALKAPSLEQTREFLLGQIKSRNPTLVAKYFGLVVGWCDVIPQVHPLYAHRGMLGMGIHMNYRGRGIGRRILQAALEASRQRGLERIELVVRATNTIAQRLYESSGFLIEGTIRQAVKMNGEYEDAYSMALLLK